MRQLRLSWVAVLALVGAAGIVHADEPLAPTPENGSKVYGSYCARCHGFNLVVSGGAFFDLRRFPKGEKDRFLNSVAKGKNAMPAWGSIMRPDQIEAVWSYIGSVNGWNASTVGQASAIEANAVK